MQQDNSLKDIIKAEVVLLLEAQKLRKIINELRERMSEVRKESKPNNIDIEQALITHLNTKALYEKAAIALYVSNGGKFNFGDDLLANRLKELDKLEGHNKG